MVKERVRTATAGCRARPAWRASRAPSVVAQSGQILMAVARARRCRCSDVVDVDEAMPISRWPAWSPER